MEWQHTRRTTRLCRGPKLAAVSRGFGRGLRGLRWMGTRTLQSLGQFHHPLRQRQVGRRRRSHCDGMGGWNMRMLRIWWTARGRWKGLAVVGESWIAGDSLDAERWLVEWEGELCGPGISCDGRCAALSQLSAGVSDVDVGPRLGDLATWRLDAGSEILKCGMSRVAFKDGNRPRCWIGDWREIHSATVLCPASYPFAASFEASRQAGIVIHLVSLFHSSPSAPTLVVITRTTPETEACSLHVSLERQSLQLRAQTCEHDFNNPSRRYRISFSFFLLFILCRAMPLFFLAAGSPQAPHISPVNHSRLLLNPTSSQMLRQTRFFLEFIGPHSILLSSGGLGTNRPMGDVVTQQRDGRRLFR